MGQERISEAGAYPMSDDHTRGERLQIMLSPDELTVLDDFRFKQRMPSRAAAVRELLKRGLAVEGYSIAHAGAKSSDYGVIDGKTEGGKAPASRRLGK
jgi:hypothetical protein